MKGRTSGLIGICSLILSVVFLSRNITGYSIANLTQTSLNFAGIVFFLVGLLCSFIYMKSPYLLLKRDNANLHNISQVDIKKFVDIADIKKGMYILDAMCGKSEIGQEIEKIDGVKLYLSDNAKFQLDEAKKVIKNAKFFTASVLDMPFKNNYFDRVFIKSGVYEVPKKNQVKLYKEVLRVLKPKGLFLNWTFLLNKNNQKFFQDIVRNKDKSAGFEDLFKNRYFMTKDEVYEDIKKAGFRNIKFYDLNIYYTLSTKKWCEVDFQGDKAKKVKLGNFIMEQIGGKDIIGMEVIIEKGDIKLKIPALISIAIK
ncbi:MAG: methyltransferase domain-containing protein [Nanoarchaeota archaeon]|nr:methyltransferase domain-containing protein [Nanoarchaeota archaeon]